MKKEKKYQKKESPLIKTFTVPFAIEGFKENIIINEVGLRECFQNINKIYNLENKLQILDGLISAGLKNIQLCSFVSPKVLPQMADAEKLNFSAPKIDNITYSAFILNVKGLIEQLIVVLKG